MTNFGPFGGPVCIHVTDAAPNCIRIMIRSILTVCAALCALCASFNVFADCNVDLKSDPLTWASSAAIVADWGTTLHGTKLRNKGYDFYEDGLIARKVIGRYPTEGRVHAYFAGIMASSLLSRCFLPEKYSDIVAVYFVVEHGSKAWQNHQIGLNIRF